MVWRVLRVTATVGGWVLAALLLSYVEWLLLPQPGKPHTKSDDP